MPSRTNVHSLTLLLRHDPVFWLLSSGDTAICTLVKRDILGEDLDACVLWDLPEARRLLDRQQANGSWRYSATRPPPLNYDLYQTLTTLGELVAKYGFDARHPSIERAAAYVFACQTEEGDYRGIYGTQPSHTYTPALMELLIEAGLGDHPSVERAFSWLLATRQDDGGWAIPVRTRDKRLVRDWNEVLSGPVVESDPSRPFSHLVTGMVLRAFAAHPRHRASPEAFRAAELLKSRFLKPDAYADRKGKAYWTRFTWPFQFTDLLTSLDSLGKMGFSATDPDLARAIDWFRQRQSPDGSFDLWMRRGLSDGRIRYWLGFVLARALLRFAPRFTP
jgi:hypothetical protein